MRVTVIVGGLQFYSLTYPKRIHENSAEDTSLSAFPSAVNLKWILIIKREVVNSCDIKA